MNPPFSDYPNRIVSLLGQVGSAEIDSLADQLLRLDTERSEDITLYLSCQGGNMVDAFKIVDIMATLQSRVTTIAMGLIQAGGVLIFSSAPERVMLPSALLSTAQLWSLPEVPPTFGFGTTELSPRVALQAQLEVQVDGLRSVQLSQLVHEAATTPRLFTAEAAVAHGLADSITTARGFAKKSLTEHIRRVR